MIQVVTLLGLRRENGVRVPVRILERIAGVLNVRETEAEGVFEVESRQILTPEQVEPAFVGSGFVVSSIV